MYTDQHKALTRTRRWKLLGPQALSNVNPMLEEPRLIRLIPIAAWSLDNGASLKMEENQ